MWRAYPWCMCDLDASERESILQEIAAIASLVRQIDESAQSVRDRNWIEHSELDRLFAELSEKAADARGWVQRKVAATHA